MQSMIADSMTLTVPTETSRPRDPRRDPRRHDLDALRAVAMLLGIALHGALSFIPTLWPVQDAHQNGLFGLLVAAIHGFRMPVFFVMSGFFTAMLWRRRGLRSLLFQRYRRVFLPLLLAALTLAPAVEWMSRKGMELGTGTAAASTAAADASEAQASDEQTAEDKMAAELAARAETLADGELDPMTGLTGLSLAVLSGDLPTLQNLLDGAAGIDSTNRDGSTALIIAAVYGRGAAARVLLEAGADVHARSADGSTALHTAAFFGRADVAEHLLEAGADTTLRSSYGQTPQEVLAADWATTSMIAKMIQMELVREDLEAGRARIAELLSAPADDSGEEAATSGDISGSSAMSFRGTIAYLTHTPLLHHLWFLAFLCWLVAAFALVAWWADRKGWRLKNVGFVLSSWRLLWLVPITFVPQFFMGRLMPVFGADTSAGLLPMPHVLAYYAVFFFFGALYYEAKDDEGRVGRWWYVALPLGLLVLFPIGLGMTFSGVQGDLGPRALSALVQATYPWVMLFGLMGIFRRFLSQERFAMRYLSDASYWLYLAHLPLILGGQILLRNVALPASVKFSLLCIGVTGILLVIYQVAVRYTWLGRLLNGPRQRRGASPSSTVAPPSVALASTE